MKVITNNKYNLRSKNKINKINKIWNPLLKTKNTYKNLKGKRSFVSATKVSNYLLKDPVIDWYNEYVNKDLRRLNIKDNDKVKRQEIDIKIDKMLEKKNCSSGSTLKLLFEMGNKFEREVIKDIERIFPNQVIRGYLEGNDNNSNYELTMNCMLKGIPFIEQATLYDEECSLFGHADLIIRSDYIDSLMIKSPEIGVNYKASKLNGNYHYIVIDIKWTNMKLCSNGKSLRNSDRIPAYKGQLAIYNLILGKMQGYIPDKAYILAKSWSFTRGRTIHKGYNYRDRLGEIDYTGFDISYIEKTAKAIEWIREMRAEGEKWSCIPPQKPELYPNMSNKKDMTYYDLKYIHAEAIKELTLLWNVGVKNRNIAHNKGILRYDDVNCTAENLGIKGNKISPILNKMIELNTSPDEIMHPKIIKNNINNWKSRKELDFFVDFETLNKVFINKNINLEDSRMISDYIFMIGVGFEEDGVFKYNSFIARNSTLEEEFRVMQDFIQFINNKIEDYNLKNLINNEHPRLFHWSNAEKTMFESFNNRHQNRFSLWNVEWVDLCKVFKKEPILIKGVMSFSLKNIAKTMKNLNYIDIEWDDDIKEGFSAAMLACEYYNYIDNNGYNTEQGEYFKYKKIIEDIERYNSVDCRVLWEILLFLRNKKTLKID